MSNIHHPRMTGFIHTNEKEGKRILEVGYFFLFLVLSPGNIEVLKAHWRVHVFTLEEEL